MNPQTYWQKHFLFIFFHEQFIFPIKMLHWEWRSASVLSYLARWGKKNVWNKSNFSGASCELSPLRVDDFEVSLPWLCLHCRGHFTQLGDEEQSRTAGSVSHGRCWNNLARGRGMCAGLQLLLMGMIINPNPAQQGAPIKLKITPSLECSGVYLVVVRKFLCEPTPLLCVRVKNCLGLVPRV